MGPYDWASTRATAAIFCLRSGVRGNRRTCGDRRPWRRGVCRVHAPHIAALTKQRKSQLAVQYAHSVRDASPQMFVFWVYASTRARFEEASRDIADRLALPGRHDPKVDALRLVSDWPATGCATR